MTSSTVVHAKGWERTPLKRLIRSMGGAGAVAAAFLILISVLALLSPILPWDPTTQNLSLRLAPPFSFGEGWQYILGGDQLGRSVAARLIAGARVTLLIGISTALLAMIIGVALGVAAGVLRGWFEAVVLRIIDVWMSLPLLVIALVVLYATGPGTWKVVLILALLRWVTFARVSRALTLSIRERQFFDAARATGCSTPRIIFRHVVPNLRWDILVIATLEVAHAMLSEAALSFLGLGVQPPDSSWGTMLASARPYLGTSPWLIFLPGLAILATTLSINLLVNGIRSQTKSSTRGTAWSGAMSAFTGRKSLDSTNAGLGIGATRRPQLLPFKIRR